jgi:ferrochelatase
MRYWHPMTDQTAAEVGAWAPDEIVLLPLYPQYSTTTTGSSARAWAKAYRGPGLVRTVCCYPAAAGLVEAHARLIREAWSACGHKGPVRLLFSAHGLPEKVVQAGDPYQVQIEATCAAVAAALGEGWDWKVCYQSRVGPMTWIGPSTEDEIRAASAEGLALVVTPIAFVSEHVETLVELDHEYGEMARAAGCPAYVRIPALGVDETFIDTLADIALASLARRGTASGDGYACAGRGQCPRTLGATA